MFRPTLLVCICLLSVAACDLRAEDAAPATKSTQVSAPCFINIVTSADKDPEKVNMALLLAGFALDEGRAVFIFFNTRGVDLPTKKFSADKKFKDGKPLKAMLTDLLKRGAVVHVCPVCMKAHKVAAEDLIAGAAVTSRPKLFEKIGPTTAVFTY